MRSGEIDHPHNIGGSVQMDAELTGNGPKHTFPLDLLTSDHIVLFFRRGVNTT